MKKLLLLLLIAASCSGGDVPLTPEEQAAEQARLCYDSLYHGHATYFLSHRLNVDSMPQSYQQQLIEAYDYYVQRMERRHQGVCGVTVSHTQRDNEQAMVQVFLQLAFADSTTERIVVPMVERDGQWMMK